MNLSGSYVEAWLSRMRMRREANASSLGEADRMRRKEGMSELKGRLLLVVVLLAAVAYASLRSNLGYLDGVDAYERSDYATALEAWQPLAEDGVAHAQFRLGNLHLDGLGVPANNSIAFSWFEKAAVQGLIPGQQNLAMMYAKEEGVKENVVEAHKWLSIALALDDGTVKFRRGRFHNPLKN